MLLFGHTGITLGAATLLAGTLTDRRLAKIAKSEAAESSSQEAITGKTAASHKASWFTSLGRYIDIRLLLVGSLLPDAIDKPVGQYFFRETLSNGRIYCHTLLFLLLIAVSGWYLYQRRRKIWLLILSFGTFTHLILDRMWENPRTLLWPLYGFFFQKVELAGWLLNRIRALFTDPEVYVPELVGAAVIAWFIWTLLRRRKVYAFLRYGQVH